MSRITLEDVASRARVSKMTVSRVLRRSGYVAEKTRARVLRAVTETGYIPNRVAGALASQRAQLVGVLVPSTTTNVYPQVLAGIAKGLDGSGLQPVFGLTDYRPETEEALVASMLSWRPSGLLVSGLAHTPAARRLLRDCDVPVAEMMDADGRAIEFAVGLSHREAGELAASHLLDRGYRRIGYVAHDHALDLTAAKRFAAFEASLLAAGRSLVGVKIGNEPSSPALGALLTEALLAEAPRVDALYFANDDVAIGGLMHCLKAGISVPRQLALCGYSGFSATQALPQTLTTIRSPRFEIGRMAARYIVARQSSPRPARAVRKTLPIELVPGDTT